MAWVGSAAPGTRRSVTVSTPSVWLTVRVCVAEAKAQLVVAEASEGTASAAATPATAPQSTRGERLTGAARSSGAGCAWPRRRRSPPRSTLTTGRRPAARAARTLARPLGASFRRSSADFPAMIRARAGSSVTRCLRGAGPQPEPRGGGGAGGAGQHRAGQPKGEGAAHELLALRPLQARGDPATVERAGTARPRRPGEPGGDADGHALAPGHRIDAARINRRPVRAGAAVHGVRSPVAREHDVVPALGQHGVTARPPLDGVRAIGPAEHIGVRAPVTFSTCSSVSVPVGPVAWGVASARSTVTGPAALAYDAVSLPTSPKRRSSPPRPSRTSSPGPPSSVSFAAVPRRRSPASRRRGTRSR